MDLREEVWEGERVAGGSIDVGRVGVGRGGEEGEGKGGERERERRRRKGDCGAEAVEGFGLSAEAALWVYLRPGRRAVVGHGSGQYHSTC